MGAWLEPEAGLPDPNPRLLGTPGHLRWLHLNTGGSKVHLVADGDDKGQVVELLLVLLLVLHEVGGAHLPHGEADGLQDPAKKIVWQIEC